MNFMLIRALLQLYLFYGDSFTVECPTGSGQQKNLFEVAREISTRLVGVFLRDAEGRRPLYGAWEKFQTDPHWRDHLIFPNISMVTRGRRSGPVIRRDGPVS